MTLLRIVPIPLPAAVDNLGVAGGMEEVVRDAMDGLPGVRDVVLEVNLEGRVLSLLDADAVEAIEEVEDIREVGVGLLLGRAAGVPRAGRAREGRGDAEGVARVDELVDGTLDGGRALRRLFALGVAGGGDTRADLADEATDEGREVLLSCEGCDDGCVRSVSWFSSSECRVYICVTLPLATQG